MGKKVTKKQKEQNKKDWHLLIIVAAAVLIPLYLFMNIILLNMPETNRVKYEYSLDKDYEYFLNLLKQKYKIEDSFEVISKYKHYGAEIENHQNIYITPIGRDTEPKLASIIIVLFDGTPDKYLEEYKCEDELCRTGTFFNHGIYKINYHYGATPEDMSKIETHLLEILSL